MRLVVWLRNEPRFPAVVDPLLQLPRVHVSCPPLGMQRSDVSLTLTSLRTSYFQFFFWGFGPNFGDHEWIGKDSVWPLRLID